MRMVKMADINKRLLTASDGIPAPQHKVKGASEFEFTEGSGGAQHTKIVDSSGQPISIDEELKSIKRAQAEILDRLDNGIDTRVTGSKGEYETFFEREIRNESTSSSRLYKPDWAKGFIAYLLINGVTGSFGDNQGIALRYRGGYSNTNYAYSVLTGRTNVSNRAHILTVFPSYGVDGESISSSGSSQRHIPSILPRIVALSIEVSGTFAQGEGFDSEVIVEWV